MGDKVIFIGAIGRIRIIKFIYIMYVYYVRKCPWKKKVAKKRSKFGLMQGI